jgi:hypothetical protein
MTADVTRPQMARNLGRPGDRRHAACDRRATRSGTHGPREVLSRGLRRSGRLDWLLPPGHRARDPQRILRLLVRRRLLRDQFATRWRERVLSQVAQHVEITAGLQHDEQWGIGTNAMPVAAMWITGRPSCL